MDDFNRQFRALIDSDPSLRALFALLKRARADLDSWSPQATGTATAILTFSSNATNGPTTESLTGSGTAATHSVALTWHASSGAVGYNIYRGGVSGGPYSMINTALDASTSYTDTNVSAGTTYYYVVTAVDSSTNESGYSNQATAVVPSP